MQIFDNLCGKIGKILRMCQKMCNFAAFYKNARRILYAMIPSKRIFILLLAVVCGVLTISAQTRQQIRDSHLDFIYLTGAAGYHGYLNQEDQLKNGAGVGAELGLGYRMYHHHFIFSLGVEGKYGFASVLPTDEKRTFPNTPDSEGDLMTLNADIFHRQDLIQNVDLQVPVLMGGEWYHFYFMAGAKVGLNMYGSAITKARLTTSGTYNRFGEDFEDMPNHQYLSNQEVRSDKQKISFNTQVYATAEIGYRFGELYRVNGADIPKARRRYYVAAFAEYGILNMHKSAAGQAAVVPVKMSDGSYSFQVSPAYNSVTFRDAAVNNLMVGVKFTMLFQLPKNKKCVLCHEHRIRPVNNRMKLPND